MIFGLFGKGRQQAHFEAGDHAWIQIADSSLREIFEGDVASLDKGGFALVSTRNSNKLTEALLPRTQVNVQVNHSGRIAMFRTRVTRLENNEASPRVYLETPKTVTWRSLAEPEKQKRSFVRLEDRLRVAVRLQDESAPKKGLTLDISANGLNLLLDSALPLDKTVHFDLWLPSGLLHGVGKVLRTQPAKSPKNDLKQEVAITFLKMDPKAQDAIVRHVFERQAERRRRKLV